MSIYANKDGHEDLVPENHYADVDTFGTLDSRPEKETKDVENSTYKYLPCGNKYLSVVILTGLLVLLGTVLLIILCALHSANSQKIEQLKQKNIETNLKFSQFEETVEAKLQEIFVKLKKHPTCSSGWKQIGLSCYYFSLESVTGLEAVDKCQSIQSQLLVLRDKAEMDLLLQETRGKSFWIGLRRFKSMWNNDMWQWVDGTTPTFTNWRTGEPNNAGGIEDCVEMKSESWNDVNCAETKNYICKINEQS
ncbi:hepatic lectin-like [Hyperolius riggenbachi]|uniref:hepatic lectin-like n=1 Tax=Hyperolius riggenbachi TaxID=752182 RepID=UPI0035A39D72